MIGSLQRLCEVGHAIAIYVVGMCCVVAALSYQLHQLLGSEVGQCLPQTCHHATYQGAANEVPISCTKAPRPEMR